MTLALPALRTGMPLHVSSACELLWAMPREPRHILAYYIERLSLWLDSPPDKRNGRAASLEAPRPRYHFWQRHKDHRGRVEWKLFNRRGATWPVGRCYRMSSGEWRASCYGMQTVSAHTGPHARAMALQMAITERYAVPWSDKPWNPTA